MWRKFVITAVLMLMLGLLAGCFALQETEEASGQVVAPAVAGQGNGRVYTIDPAESEVRFVLNEVLNNRDTVVTGVTNNLGGQIALDLANPATAELSAIVVNARDIATDNQFRNRAIGNQILRTNTYEFITFTPTQLVGLPATAAVGQTYSFQINGELTITDQTLPVTFAATVTVVSEGELRGTAEATIFHADFGLQIPFSQSVQAVDEDLRLQIDFVAR